MNKLKCIFVLITFIFSLFLSACSKTEITQTESLEEYDIFIANSQNGYVLVDKNKSTPGETITITIVPDACYVFDKITVETSKFDVTVINQNFIMPEDHVTIIATFKETPCTKPFDDVTGDVYIWFNMPDYGFVNRNIDIDLEVSHQDYEIILTSSDVNVASIENGVLNLKSPGTTMIRAEYKRINFSTYYILTVREYFPMIVTGENQVLRDGFTELFVTDLNDFSNRGVSYYSSDDMIASVNRNGIVFGHKPGVVTISIVSVTTNDIIEHEIEVINPKPDQLVIDDLKSVYDVNQIISLKISLLPLYSEGKIIGYSSNNDIIEVNENLDLIVKDIVGEVVLVFYVDGDSSVSMIKNVSVISPYTIDALVSKIKESEVMAKTITVFGYQFNYSHQLLGSVIPYYFGKNTITDAIIPIGNKNRLSITAPVHYIVIHDTGSTASTANESAHSNYVRNSNTTVSWHYTVGANAIYRHLPDIEQGIHSGDGGRVYQLIDSGISGINQSPKVTIDLSGYYELDGIKTLIKAPMAGTRLAKTSDIVDTGIRVVIGENGNYMIGTTYFSGLSRIANTGGDKNGIGIEMTIHQGSDLFLAYQKLAKLVSELLVLHKLTPDDVKQHNFFTGKNCPQTLRQSGYWDAFMEMVWVEFILLRYFPNYQIEITSLSPEWVNPNGRLIKMPLNTTTLMYELIIKKDDDLIYKNVIEKLILIP